MELAMPAICVFNVFLKFKQVRVTLTRSNYLHVRLDEGEIETNTPLSTESFRDISMKKNEKDK